MEPDAPTPGDGAGIADLQDPAQERDQLARLLTEAEQRLARVPELELRIADLEYEYTEDKSTSPWVLASLKPIQISHFDLDGYLAARKQFSVIGPLAS